MNNRTKAVVLLSGGLDSTTTLAMVQEQGFSPYCLSFSYGQRDSAELEAAARVAEEMGAVEHVIAPIDLRLFGGSALTAGVPLPKTRSIEEMSEGIPVTYVPARNTILLSFALAWAEVISALDIFIGVSALDYRSYPDCRPEFILAYQAMANLGTRAGVGGAVTRIHTPLISMTKAEIVNRGMELGVDFSMTLSCYDPSDLGVACGQCDGCILRLKGFAEAGVTDPAAYAASPQEAAV